MVSLVGPTTATATEGLNGAGNITVAGTVANIEPGVYYWLPGGYSVLSAPGFGTLTINFDGVADGGGYTWSFVFGSDDPALDTLDSGSSLDITFNVRVFDVSWGGTGSPSTVNGTTVVDTHQVTITIFGENEVCFTRGTEIATPDGPRMIEDLQVGDLVLTRDNGAQPVKWLGYSEIAKARRRGNEGLEPILIQKDAFEPGVPARDLAVSPQHRILLMGQLADDLFDSECHLVPAKHLCDGQRIRPCGERFDVLEYWHMMLDNHDVVFANGCPVETFYFGPMSAEILDGGQIKELAEIFPNLSVSGHEINYTVLKAKEAMRVTRYLGNAFSQ